MSNSLEHLAIAATEKKVNYPQNLLTALKIDIKNPSEDQILGLEFALGQLKESEQEVLCLHYEKGLTYNEIGIQTGRSGSRCASIARRAVLRLQRPNRLAWILEGYKDRLTKINEQAEEARKQFMAEGKTEQANLMILSPDSLNGIIDDTFEAYKEMDREYYLAKCVRLREENEG